MGGFSLPSRNKPGGDTAAKGGARNEHLSLGVDIGSHSVKICQLGSAGAGYKLLAVGSAALPVGAVEEGILQDAQAVGAAIVNLVKNLKLKEKKVAISVSGFSVIVKKINLTVMADAELEQYIQNEAGQYIPFDMDDVFLDYQDLHTSSEDNDRTDVILVAAKKDMVEGYLGMLEGAKLKPVVVDIDGFALENIYGIASSGADESIALVDIGASKTSINIVSHGSSVLSRDVVVGSRQITEQIQNRLGLGFEEAEAIKVGVDTSEDFVADLEDIFVHTCTQWALEIRKAVDLFYSNYPDETINKIVISGGGAKVNGLDAFLADEIGIAVERFDPFARLEVDPDRFDKAYLAEVGPEMAIALGLATRPVEL